MDQSNASLQLSGSAADRDNKEEKPKGGYASVSVPQISLPKSGGAIKTIDDKLSVNAINGSAGCSFAFPLSASRNGFVPSLSLDYNSASGNGAFGLGWSAELPSIAIRSDKKLPQYNNEDVFVFSGAEDLVPVFNRDASGQWLPDSRTTDGITITRYRPRIEGGFARTEKITEANGNVYWKVTDGSNVVSIFGKSQTAKLFDPADQSKVFKWLLEFSYDDKGNCFQYEYRKEDHLNVPEALHEKNRLNGFSACTNVYLKKIKYCNRVHFHRATIDRNNWEQFLNNIEYLLELVLDYGEHDLIHPQPTDDNGWTCRQDAFSDYRAGFEIRTYRLCHRLLMFHRFAELGTQPCLVRSMDMVYNNGTAFTFLQSITQSGYTRKPDGSYSTKSLPPVEFTYEALGWDTEVKTLSDESLENLPTGIDNNYRWIDLYNEGIAGILTEQQGGWYYKSNAGDGRLEGSQSVSPKPSLTGISAGSLHFQDIEAKGQQFLVSDDLNGYYEMDDNNEWQPFKNFTHVPNTDLRDPNLKMLDLDGDGMADILISEERVFNWHASKGKEGYTTYQTTPKAIDEEKGPNIIFADSTESIVLADMSGDGLMDIVRIRYADVSYWPNLGYGKFGARISMTNAPVLDTPEDFNPRYVKLADLDGSGTTDIIYFGKNVCKIYFNQSGNSLSEQNIVNGANSLPFPKTDAYSSVNVIDLLGNGTACIVWSSPLPQYAGNQLRFIDLMGGKKPHIMVSYKNSMGKETRLEYLPSTFFYLQDKKNGTPWITKLPFPVQCVSKTIVIDQIRKSRFTAQYNYHHGYYDHAEREFRGFGRVDQTDTESFEEYRKFSAPGSIQLVDVSFHQPPVLTKTWFHTGAFLDKEKVLNQFAHEYYSNNVIPEKVITDAPLPAGLTVEEYREALRACKGLALRTEMYSPDGSDKQHHPYTISASSCEVKLLQPTLNNAHAVFMVQQRESIAYAYERDPSDPRIAHSMTLETDQFGNPLTSAAISYGRKTVDTTLTTDEQAEQAKLHVVFSKHLFTNDINTTADYHLPAGYESLSYELTGVAPVSDNYFSIPELNTAFEQAQEIVYEASASGVTLQKRLLERTKTLLLKDDMSGPLTAGVLEPLALPYQSYKLSLTPSLREVIYGNKVTDEKLINEGKYVHLEDDNYWITSGTQLMDAGNFYQVTEVADPFGNTTRIVYDSAYRLFVKQTTDTLQNTLEVAGFNYRTVSPYLLKDINGNMSGVRTDELGMLVSGFIMGKAGEGKGDLMDITSVEAAPGEHPSSVFEYNLFNYRDTGKPNFMKSVLAETHYHDSILSGKPVVYQTAYSYADGSGDTVMRKSEAEPGIALQENADGTVTEVDTTPDVRWIGNGRTIVNNKGDIVKQYEPYFSTTFGFEDAKELVERGVSPIIFYDAIGRNIRTDMPDGTFAKVVFDSWSPRTYDQNDTVLDSQWYKDRIMAPVTGVATPEEISAAQKAAAHSDTPAISYLDSFGRGFLFVADNGAAGKYKKRLTLDVENNMRQTTDARGNVVIEHRYDMLGAMLYSNNMDAGERWVLNDVMGRPIYNWDGRGHVFHAEYDVLSRPVKSFVQNNGAPAINTDKMLYGESVANAAGLNMRGRVYQHFDTAGITTNTAYDFRGNVVSSSKQLCSEYKNDIDWNSNPVLDDEIFTLSSVFDALNRPLLLTYPDQSIVIPSFNEANLLEKVEVHIRGAAEKKVFVEDIDYDVKGRRERILYGNNTVTKYKYDAKTLRLTELVTTGNNGADLLQHLHYTHDPVGNVTDVKDEAQQTIFFNNTVVNPSAEYIYDAIYRLIHATGREHIGQDLPPSPHDGSRSNLPMPGDGAAMRNYQQQYEYDPVGNITKMIHVAGSGSWTRVYDYDTSNNRLNSNGINNSTENFTYDEHGNIQSLSHLQALTWNFKDQLQHADLGGGGHAYYVYDGNGKRIRKVIERQGGIKEERIYIGVFELFRRTDGAGAVTEQTETLRVADNSRVMAMVETKTIKDGIEISPDNIESLIRFQYSNHLGSSVLELDEEARIISYEEYHPYGTTSYQSINASINATAKRFRYTGMERDDETGLEYHGARYYLPWLARWLNADPQSIDDGLNVYQYIHSNPLAFVDTSGTETKRPEGTSLLMDMMEIIYERHAYDGFAKTDVLKGKLQLAIIAMFVGVAERSFTVCKDDGMSSLKLFDIGVEIIAKRYGLEKQFRAAAYAGDQFFEGNAARAISLHEEFFVDGNGRAHRVAIPETKAQHEAFEFRRQLARLRGFDAWVNLVGSMGLPGAGGGGGGGRGNGRQMAWGAPLEPLPSRNTYNMTTQVGPMPKPDMPAPKPTERSSSAVPEPIPAEKTAPIPVPVSDQPTNKTRSATSAPPVAPAAPGAPVAREGYMSIEVTFPGNERGFVRLINEGKGVIVMKDIHRGSAPKGTGGIMMADAIKAAKLGQPTALIATSIVNEPTVKALKDGTPFLDTVIGRMTQLTVKELGGTIDSVTPVVFDHKPSYRINISYRR